MGIIDGKLLLCHGISEERKDKTISTRKNKSSTGYECFNKPFLVYGGILDFNTPPIPIENSPQPKNNPGIPLILFQLPFMLPM